MTVDRDGNTSRDSNSHDENERRYDLQSAVDTVAHGQRYRNVVIV